jgi:hypothetical protein
MNMSSVNMDTHAILMKMMDKVDETTKRNLTLQKEEIEKYAEMKATEKHFSFRELLIGSIDAEQKTDKTTIGTGSDGVNIAVRTFPQNYSEHRILTQSKAITVK